MARLNPEHLFEGNLAFYHYRQNPERQEGIAHEQESENKLITIPVNIIAATVASGTLLKMLPINRKSDNIFMCGGYGYRATMHIVSNREHFYFSYRSNVR
jgi:hypothetical protein